jgi:hypothetical protein
MATRKKRDKASKGINYLEPFDVTKLGSDADPCFGKLYDPTVDECKACGDCELCSVVMNQKTEISRKREEKKARFLDVEETALQNKPINIIYARLKRAAGKFVTIEKLKQELNRKGIAKKEITNMEVAGFFKRLLNDSNVVPSKTKTKVRWKIKE